jgi:hypothetical protein
LIENYELQRARPRGSTTSWAFIHHKIRAPLLHVFLARDKSAPNLAPLSISFDFIVRQDAYSGTAPCAHRAARRHIDTRDLFKFYSKQTPTFGKIIRRRRFDTYREEGEARKRRVIGFLGTNISPRDLQFNMRDGERSGKHRPASRK